MKRIRRPQVSLPTLRPDGKGGLEAARRLGVFQANRVVKEVNDKFVDHWSAPDVRGSLWAMQGRSCAYCDRNLPGNDRGDVEHFRPKNTYWWLAYEFDNYLLSCSVCNSAYKGSKFPILPPDGPLDYARKDKLPKERRVLIDPALDPIEGWFGIDFDFDTTRSKGSQLTLSATLGRADKARAEATTDFFRLNSDAELLKDRMTVVHTALRLIDKANKGDTDARDDLRRMASRFSAFSFAVREAIVAYAKRPDYLPAPDDELDALVDDLLQTLHFASRAVKARPNDSTETDRRDRCAWALAVLMHDPPARSTEALRERFRQEQMLELIEPKYAQLRMAG